MSVDKTEQPNYILRFNDGILAPKDESTLRYVTNVIFWSVTVLISILSIVFQEPLWKEFKSTTCILMIPILAYLIRTGGHKRRVSPCEWWFYDEKIIIYRHKAYYSRKNIQREYYTFRYSDIKRCQYRKDVEKINFYGVYEGTVYKYGKDGEVSNVPSYHRLVDSIETCYTVFEPDIDFVAEIEKHSPIRVEIVGN